MTSLNSLITPKPVDDSEDYLLDEVELLKQELAKTSPGYESALMRLLVARVTMNNMFQFCGLCDTEGVAWETNSPALQAVGVLRSEAHGRPFWEGHWWARSPIAQQQLQEAVRRAAQGEFVRHDIEVLNNPNSQEVRIYDFNLNPIKDRQGNVVYMTIEGRDVTEQRREREFRTVVENTPDLIIRYDRQLRHVFVNPSVEGALGIPPEQFIGKTAAEMGFTDSTSQAWEVVLRDVFQTGRDRSFEFEFPLPQGEWRSYQARFVPELAHNAVVKTVLVVVRDVTEYKQAERAVRQSEERYRYLAELIPQLVWTADAEGVLIDANQRWLNFTGLTLLDAQTQGWRAIVHPDDIPLLTEQWMAAQQSGTLYKAEGRMRRADGVYRWHLHQAMPLKNEQGQVIKWFGTATDIDDQKQLEQQRDRLLQQEQAARAEAEAANRVKDEFLAVLSHELRSPLNPILGWTRLLRNYQYDAATTERALETIERNAKTQAQLVDDLLDVACILRGKLVLNTKTVDLVDVITGAIESVRLAAEAKAIPIHADLPQAQDNPPDEDGFLSPSMTSLQVAGDPGRLQQVLWNLLSNAVKFTPVGGQVNVCLESLDFYAQITVADNGRGISPEFLPYIFDCFRQADSSTTRKFGGLGLGLAIVRYIVELHGGTVSAESPGEGQGATFTIRLPLLRRGGTDPQEHPTVYTQVI